MAVTEPEVNRYDTHEVFNQVPPLENYNMYEADTALQEALKREGAAAFETEVRDFGQQAGTAHVIELGFLANKYIPELRTHDRYGHRMDEVEYHPAYHELMALGIGAGVHSSPWANPGPGANVARAAKSFMLGQQEAGVGCPITMTFACVPALRHQPEVAEEWLPRILSTEYDPRMVPAPDKKGVTIGMAMTEKQGGSDVRANTTHARPIGATGPGQPYELTGHKWFCSAPMCDAFLTLAHTDNGLTCFLVPRWRPDGTRNAFYIQRLKDKVGNRSNASSEIEYLDTYGVMVGEEGRGVRTIIEMVNHTRLDCCIGSSALVRHAVAQAAHHAQYRSAFGALLRDQPLMQNVLADLALESEACTATFMRLARAYDEAPQDETERHFARLATAVSKYWICKRAPGLIYEAMECLGGAGYVEESVMPRLYREAPVNAIWEGSGNVMCLDVLRAMGREPETVDAFLGELSKAKGANAALDKTVESIKGELSDQEDIQFRARRIVEQMALAFQASILVQHAPSAVADAFCAARLGNDGGLVYGTLLKSTDCDTLITRATPLN